MQMTPSKSGVMRAFVDAPTSMAQESELRSLCNLNGYKILVLKDGGLCIVKNNNATAAEAIEFFKALPKA